jgi:ferredoxin
MPIDQELRPAGSSAAPRASAEPPHDDASAPAGLRLLVDLNRCQGYAQCCFLAPDVFELHGEEALFYVPEPAPEQRDRVLRAVASCPVQAIDLEIRDRRDAS